MKMNARFEPIRNALSHRDFRYFSCGNVVSHIGTWTQRVAVGWLTWQLTHSPTWLGIIAFADLFPTVVLAPITGAVADRVERLPAMKIFQSFSLAQSILLTGLTLAGWMSIELLVALTVIGGSIVSFNQPIRLSVIPALVPRSALSTAIGINSLIFNGARFLGPMVAGLVIVRFGVGYAFLVNAISFLVFLVALTAIRLPYGDAPPPTRRSVRDLPSEIITGYSYAVRHRGIGPMLLMLTMVSIFARPFTELLPGFADEVFGRGAAGLAWLTSMTGFGAMLGGLWLALRGAVIGLTGTTIAGTVALAAALIAFAATDVFWIALPCLVAAGFALITVGVGLQTLIQGAVAPALRGRVMGLYGMIGRGAPAIGALIMGSLSSYVGLRWPVLGGAAICVGVWVWARTKRATMTPVLEGGGRDEAAPAT